MIYLLFSGLSLGNRFDSNFSWRIKRPHKSVYSELKKMEELLNAAQEGSVETLLKLLQQDPRILCRYISGCYKETPLHIAAMFGHLEFTKVVLSHTPKMAEELDSRNSTPLHVATALGHILVVKELLSVKPTMCFAKDREGRNPLHIAVIKGHIKILRELVRYRPQAAQVPFGNSTILHLCVKHNRLNALKLILEENPNDAEFVNVKDEEGFTVLHSAVAEKQVEDYHVDRGLLVRNDLYLCDAHC